MRRAVATLASAAVLVAAGFGLGRIGTDAPADAPPAVSTVATTPTTASTVAPEAPATTAPATTAEQTAPDVVADPGGPAMPEDAAVEPVAAVAEAVGPAVVQIDTPTGLGSGVLYDTAGYILTAAHVVDGSRSLTVRLADGRVFDGTVLGAHEATDIAVVQIDGSPDLPTATLAVGVELRVGQMAVALGSPFGLDQTVTAGIVSAVNRPVNGVAMVQTDAAVNPGNSGGPLLDREGRVIGINDLIFSQGGGNDGVGFAIAIDVAVVVADQIVAGEDVQLALLGVSTSSAVSGEGGAIVQEVVPGSAAARAGIEVSDRIVSVDGRTVDDSSDLRALVIGNRPGTAVEIGLVRNGSTLDVVAILGSTDG